MLENKGSLYRSGDETFALFERYLLVTDNEGEIEQEIYWLEDHLALVLRPGYGMLVQNQFGKPLDKEKVIGLDKKSTRSDESYKEKKKKAEEENK